MKKIYIIFLLVLMLFVFSCVENFKFPSWNVNLSVPLMDKNFPLADIDSEEDIMIEDGEFLIKHNETLEGDTVTAAQLIIGQKQVETEIPPQDVYFEDELTISDIGEIDEQMGYAFGIVNSWTMNIDFNLDGITSHNMDTIVLTFPDINPVGAEDILTIEITDFDNTTSVNLDGCTIGDENSQTIADILEEIQFGIDVQTNAEIPQGGLPIMRVFFDEIQLQRIRGVVSDKLIDIPDKTTDIDIDYPAGINEAIQLAEATLTVNLTSEIGMDCNLYAVIRAYNEDNDYSEFYVGYEDPNDNTVNDFLIEAAEDINTPKVSSISFTGEKVANLLNIFPNRLVIEDAHIIIERDLDMDDLDAELGFVEIGQGIDGDYETEIPFDFYINNESVKPDSIFEVEISHENRDYLCDYTNRANMIFKLGNSMNFAANVNIFMSHSNIFENVYDSLYIHPTTGKKNIVFKNNFIDAATASGDGESEVSFEMNYDEIQFMDNDKIYVGIEAVFSGSEEQVTIKPEDYIKVLGRVDAEVKVDPEEELQ